MILNWNYWMIFISAVGFCSLHLKRILLRKYIPSLEIVLLLQFGIFKSDLEPLSVLTLKKYLLRLFVVMVITRPNINLFFYLQIIVGVWLCRCDSHCASFGLFDWWILDFHRCLDVLRLLSARCYVLTAERALPKNFVPVLLFACYFTTAHSLFLL